MPKSSVVLNAKHPAFPNRKKLRVLVFTSLFPNSVDRFNGNFVLERLRFLLKFVDASVIAPVPYFPAWIPANGRWGDLARVPQSEYVGGLQTHHPRYVVFPK